MLYVNVKISKVQRADFEKKGKKKESNFTFHAFRQKYCYFSFFQTPLLNRLKFVIFYSIWNLTENDAEILNSTTLSV